MRRRIHPLTHVLLIETTGMRERCLHRRLLHHKVPIAIEVTTVTWTEMCQSMLPKWNRGTTYHYQDDGDYIPEYANYDLPLNQEDEELTFAT